jgi:hypothetical protein
MRGQCIEANVAEVDIPAADTAQTWAGSDQSAHRILLDADLVQVQHVEVRERGNLHSAYYGTLSQSKELQRSGTEAEHCSQASAVQIADIIDPQALQARGRYTQRRKHIFWQPKYSRALHVKPPQS